MMMILFFLLPFSLVFSFTTFFLIPFFVSLSLLHLIQFCMSSFASHVLCFVGDHFSVVIRFAGVCYGRFMVTRYKFNLVTYVQRPLVIDRRGGTERNLNEIMAGSRGRKAVAYESNMRECQWPCLLNKMWFAFDFIQHAFSLYQV
jgi:hypothetical protein